VARRLRIRELAGSTRSPRAGDAPALLNATPVHLYFLYFLDDQYEPEDPRDLANAVIERVEHHRPGFVVDPLGLQHADHARVREAVLADDLGVPVWLYEDLPYRVKGAGGLKGAAASQIAGVRLHFETSCCIG
jgi:LmbE family N-acetylglucosaminyl deacetylase